MKLWHQKSNTVRLLVSLLAIAVLVAGRPAPSSAQDPARLRLVPSVGTVAVGTDFNVTVLVEGVTGLAGFSLELDFDPAVVQVRDLDPAVADQISLGHGSVFAGKAPVIAVNRADNTAGRAHYTALVAKANQAFSGNGSLVVVGFRAVGPGTTTLGFVGGSTTAPDGVVLGDLAGQALPHVAQGLSIVVGPGGGQLAPVVPPAEPDAATGEPEATAADEPDEPQAVTEPSEAPAEAPITPGPAAETPAVGAPGVPATVDRRLVLVGEPREIGAVPAAARPPVLALPYGEDVTPDMELFLGLYREDMDNLGVWHYVGGRIDRRERTVMAALHEPGRYAVGYFRADFPDVAGHWAEDTLVLLGSRRVVGGYPSGEFRPDAPVTRAEITKLLVEALDRQPDRRLHDDLPAAATFADVPATEWYYPYVEAAAQIDLVRGAGGLFRPQAPITREELTTMLVRALGLEGEAAGLDADELAERLPFTDAVALPEWAQPTVATAAFHGVVRGLADGRFGAGLTATRAEAATLIYRLMHRQGLLDVPVLLTGTLQAAGGSSSGYVLHTAAGEILALYNAPANLALAAKLAGLEGQMVQIESQPAAATGSVSGGPFEVMQVREIQP